jgi:DNA-binding SARP family transcriptional activator
LRHGEEVVHITVGSQRLATFLALHERLLARTHVAGMLWPEVPSGRASANLRAAIWRLPYACRSLIDISNHHLQLAKGVVVDLHAAAATARRLLDRSPRDDDLNDTACVDFSRDLLPDWYDDDWVLAERECFHQLRLHALEALCERLTAAGRFGGAIDAGMAAVRAEPLRESAHRVLINAYISEGNRGEAGRQYEQCRNILRKELGVEPSAGLRSLLPQKLGPLFRPITSE